jgi:membrane-bound lytic murein transglycosylase A
MNQFDLYESVGWDGSGEVLFTGYCAMDFDASRTRSSEFSFPLYTRPADLVIDEKTGKVLGQRVGSELRPYPTRRQIEESGMLAGTELVYVRSALDAYFIQVNGSAKLWLDDGGVMYLGYSGTNGRPYTGLGATMIKRGIVDPSRVGLPFIRDYYKTNPQDVLDMIRENDRYVFFTAYESGKWPAGSLGFRVTEKRTIATDKDVFPRGGAVIVDTRIPTFGRSFEPFTQLMFDQDTGGAIKAPGRGDLYMGEGAAAGLIAGRQYQEGRLYYLFLKEAQFQAEVSPRR